MDRPAAGSTHISDTSHPFDSDSADRSNARELEVLATLGWQRVDHIAVDHCQIDHVLAGPGGVFVVDSKWTDEPWQLADGLFDNSHARRALAHAREGAARLGTHIRADHGLRCEVTGLLVIWAPGRPMIESPVETEGVLVMPGHLLAEALATRPATIDDGLATKVIQAARLLDCGREEHAARSSREPVLVG